MTASRPALALTAPDQVARLRAALGGAGYREAGILALLGLPRWPTLRQAQEARPLYLVRTRGGEPLETLVRLFMLGEPAPLAAVRRALAPVAPEEAAALGLLALDAAEARATVQLCAYQELVAAADWPAPAGADHDQVMDIGTTSRFLAQMTVRRPAGRALDLGTGCGVQALLAAGHCEEVVGVDANPRAVNLAAFSAQLNARGNVTCLEGDFGAPVAGQAFDLIVCNPPFVIGPQADYLHSDGGRPQDELCRAVVRAAAPLLRPGGYCQLLANWAHVRGQDWRARLADWFAGTGCDAWVLHAEPQDAAGYAAERVAEREAEPGRAAPRFAQWLAYFEAQQIEAIGYGLLTLRRSERPQSWLRFDRLPEVRGPCGAAILRVFAAQDFLVALPDEGALFKVPLRLAPELRWEQERAPTAEGWSLLQSRLRLTEGLTFAGNAGLDVIDFVSRFGGGARLDKVLGVSASAARQGLRPEAAARLELVRRLLEHGYLVPELPPTGASA